MGTKKRPAGPVLDELNVTLDLADDDRVTDVLVIAKTTDLATGEVGLVLASNDLDWIAHRGLLSAAHLVAEQDEGLERVEEDDDG